MLNKTINFKLSNKRVNKYVGFDESTFINAHITDNNYYIELYGLYFSKELAKIVHRDEEVFIAGKTSLNIGTPLEIKSLDNERSPLVEYLNMTLKPPLEYLPLHLRELELTVVRRGIAVRRFQPQLRFACAYKGVLEEISISVINIKSTFSINLSETQIIPLKDYLTNPDKYSYNNFQVDLLNNDII